MKVDKAKLQNKKKRKKMMDKLTQELKLKKYQKVKHSRKFSMRTKHFRAISRR